MFGGIRKKLYLCIAIERENNSRQKRRLLLMLNGPFVYRLGRKIFILERAVRFRYGLLFFMYIVKQNFT